MNIKMLSILFMASSTLVCGCSEEKQPGSGNDTAKSDSQSKLQLACEASGGSITGSKENERCICDKITCDSGLVCDFTTGKCSAKEVSGLCTGETQVCSNSVLYKCHDLSLQKELDCQFGCLADSSGCNECLSDSCADGKLTSCQDNKFGKVTLCSSGRCSDETTCEPECTGSETRCFEGKMQHCVDNVYLDNEKCLAGCNKEGTACLNSCEDGSTVCVDGYLRECVDGVLDEGFPCSYLFSCKSATECGECKNGTYGCQDGNVTECIKGRYVIIEQCPQGVSCMSASECGVCHDGDTKCIDDDQGKGELQTCAGGKWGSPEACGTASRPLSCRNGTECGECLNGETICNNRDDEIGESSKCIAGQFVMGRVEFLTKEFTPGINCSTSCLQNYNQCGQCINGSPAYCDNSDSMLITCEGGRENTTPCNAIQAGSVCIDKLGEPSRCAIR